jgi:hypothetical protein
MIQQLHISPSAVYCKGQNSVDVWVKLTVGCLVLGLQKVIALACNCVASQIAPQVLKVLRQHVSESCGIAFCEL